VPERVPELGDLFRCHGPCQGTDIPFYGTRWYVVDDNLLSFCMACLHDPDFNPASTLRDHVCTDSCWRRNSDPPKQRRSGD